MLIHKMLSKPKVLRTLMVGIWLGFLMFGVHSSKMKEKRESGCCGGNKETIKLKTQYVEIEQTLHDKEKQLEELKENMTRETDEWKRKTTQLESTIEGQSSEIEQKNKIIEDKENKLMNLSIEYGTKRKNYINGVNESYFGVRNVLQLQRVFFWLMVLLHEKCNTAPPLILDLILSYTGAFLTVSTVKYHAQEITALCCSLDHSFLFSGAYNLKNWNTTTNDIKMWDIGTGTCLRVFHGPIGLGNISGLAISRDNKTLVSCSSYSLRSDDAMVQIWNTITGEEYYRVFTPNVRPISCSFFSDDKFLLIGFIGYYHTPPHQSTFKIINVIDRVVLRDFSIQPTLEYARLNDDRIVIMIDKYQGSRIEVINNGVVQYSFPSTSGSGRFLKTGNSYIDTTKTGMMTSQSVVSGETTIIMNIDPDNDQIYRRVTTISSDTNNRLVATSHYYYNAEFIDLWDIQDCQCIKRIVLKSGHRFSGRSNNARFFTEDLKHFIVGDSDGNVHTYLTDLK